MRDDPARLRDILDAIDKIEQHTNIEKAAFEHDEMIQVWVVHHIQIIGEAVARLSTEFRDLHPEIPWRVVASMRNIIVHGYFRVDMDEVWNVVQQDLPVLKSHIQAILAHRTD